MDIRQLKQQTFDIISNIKKCRDPLSLCVLQDILEIKRKKLNALIELKKKQTEMKDALDNLISQRCEDNATNSEAYQQLLEDNERDKKMNNERINSDRQWNRFADPRYVNRVEQDFSNNKLMERMNGELDFRLNGIDKDTVLKPYSQIDEDTGDYVPINKFHNHSVPPDNFSSRRFLGARKNI